MQLNSKQRHQVKQRMGNVDAVGFLLPGLAFVRLCAIRQRAEQINTTKEAQRQLSNVVKIQGAQFRPLIVFSSIKFPKLI